MSRRQKDIARLVAAFLAAFVPIVASSPGRVGADTKTYLYLDPGRLLSGATDLWDSDVALGTVTHQNIGYLWPMGPWYWVLEQVGSPDWLAQRLWLATLLFAAGAGVWFLLRTFGWEGHGLLVAMLAYELSPYLLDYSARISAVLLPWAGLPWLIALTVRAARSGGWRHPALFALVVVTVGSVNATSLLLVGIAPVLWLVHATFVERSLSVSEATRTALRIGSLSLGVSLWWIAGLVLQGGYSLPVTRYTETYEAVASASTAPEVLRGLGYWFFYGNDKYGPWIEPSVTYTQGIWLLALSFGLAVLAIAAAALVRWRHRSYFVLLVVVGALVAIGAYPFDSPSTLGRLFRDFTQTDAGLALRSTPRAVPLVILATAVLLGALVNAVARRWPRSGRPVAIAMVVLVVLNIPPMWRMSMIEPHLDRGEELPDYWIEATDRLDELDDGTRVWEVPGAEFASYRWGNTVDPITPGLMERGYVARELVPFGSAESAGLLTAFDRRMQEDTLDPAALAPIARLMSVGDVLHRADLTYERYRTPRPVPTAAFLDTAPGLGRPEGYGEPVPNVAGPEQTLHDEVELAIDPQLRDPSPVTRYPVADALPVVRTRPVESTIVVAGDADGIIDAAGADLIDTDRTMVFAADLLADDDFAERVLSAPSTVVVTDSNRRRARKWGTLRENVGYTEQVGEEPLRVDPSDNRLPVFPDIEIDPDVDADDARTVAVQRGPLTARATAYGNPVTYTNDDRAVLAVDGDPTTAWSVAAFGEPRGEFLRLEFPEPVAPGEMNLTQLGATTENRHITEVRISADGRHLADIELDGSSQTPEGQTIVLPDSARGTTWDIEILDVDLPRQATYSGGVSPVGFSEVRLGPEQAPVTEWIRTPRALVDRLGEDLDEHSLEVLLTRERSNPSEPVRGDPERSMHRLVPIPVDREFEIGGGARLAADAPEVVIDDLVGRDVGADGVGLRAESSGILAGDLQSRASNAFDGDPATAWTGTFGTQVGQWISVGRDAPAEIDGLDLEVVVDPLHSVPTTLRVLGDGREVGVYPTGLAMEDLPLGSTRTISLPVAGTWSELTVVIETSADRQTQDWYSSSPRVLPTTITEIDAGPSTRFGPTAAVDTGCRDDLVSVDGVPVSVRVTGSAEDALDRSELAIDGCAPVATRAGDIEVVTTPGASTGIDVDQLILSSDRLVPVPAAPGQPEVTSAVDTRIAASVPGSASDRWFVLGQSHNDGWTLSVDGVDQGEPVLIDGFANGWILPAGDAVDVVLEWTPQRLVGRTLAVSAVFIVLCALLAWRGRRDRPQPDGSRVDGPERPTIGPLPLVERNGSRRVGRVASVVGAISIAVFSALNLPSAVLVAVGLGIVFYVSVRVERVGSFVPLLAAASLWIAALAVMVEQRRFRRPPDFSWPRQFDEVHVLGVIAVLLLAVEYLRSALNPDRPD